MNESEGRKDAPSQAPAAARQRQMDLAVDTPLIKDLIKAIEAGSFAPKSRFIFFARGGRGLALIERPSRRGAERKVLLGLVKNRSFLRAFLNGRIPVAWVQTKTGRGLEIFGRGGDFPAWVSKQKKLTLTQLLDLL